MTYDDGDYYYYDYTVIILNTSRRLITIINIM